VKRFLANLVGGVVGLLVATTVFGYFRFSEQMASMQTQCAVIGVDAVYCECLMNGVTAELGLVRSAVLGSTLLNRVLGQEPEVEIGLLIPQVSPQCETPVT
jgi:hypothetical protein